MTLKQARFVQDCVAYLQNNPSPARDVFTHSSALVSSVVVVPLLRSDDGAAIGALYFTQAAPCDFDNIQDALLVGMVGSKFSTMSCLRVGIEL